jgi:hypothetical protein
VLLENNSSGNTFFFYVNLIFDMPKRKDEIELAKSIFDEIVEETESEDWNKPINKNAQNRGKARAAKLTPAERSAIAKKAAQSRWKKSES